MKKALAILLTAVMLLGVLTACGSKKDDAADDTQNTEDTDKAAADNVAALIDAIYVQERTDETRCIGNGDGIQISLGNASLFDCFLSSF